ncbi:hypothetical protein CAPTEDRAFT_208525 [Capitella teleta]|uniref:Reverse transcriptase domain-containing protein n=1 Tax=Capitella teleta TaxID=283909 RepID=R7TM32_CAPTE|nr:hypothetical protein CAPTEDRAFT_208525 [Capitella teleta]|eukprot:ELT92616.1 hypothetical protein CAPTEDRAFT_208525 [Capitella teleta]
MHCVSEELTAEVEEKKVKDWTKAIFKELRKWTGWQMEEALRTLVRIDGSVAKGVEEVKEKVARIWGSIFIRGCQKRVESKCTFHVRTSGTRSQDRPLDVGVVQCSGLSPVMWNVYFAIIFDSTEDTGIGFTDDLNLITQDVNEFGHIKSQQIVQSDLDILKMYSEVLLLLPYT